MTSVNALCLHPTTDHPGRAVPPPDFWPSWTAPYENLLHTTPTYAGYTTKWYSKTTIRHSLSIPKNAGPPAAVALAHFPSVDVPPISNTPSTNSDPDWVSWKHDQSASLCVAYQHYVAVSTPHGDHIHCPLHDTFTARGSVSALFAPLFGLIVEKTSPVFSEDSPKHTYYYLRRPLEEMTPISLPSKNHQIVYVSSDVPLAVSRGQKTITVWNIQEAEEGLPEPSVEKVETSDPISAFISNSVPDRPDETAILPRRKVLTFRKLYVAPADPSDPLSVFMAHDLRGQVVLCLCISNVLTGLDLGMQDDRIHDMPVAFRIRDAASATPILGIRGNQNALDILVRHISGSMSLFIGPDRLCAVQAQPSSKVQGFSDAGAKRDDLVVSDAVGSRFSLVNGKGHGFRFSLYSISCCSPLVNDCIDAISCRFYTQGIIQQMIPLYQAILNVRAKRDFGEIDRESRDRDWEIFEHIFFCSTTSKLSSSRGIVTDAMEIDSKGKCPMDKDIENGDDDWDFLLSSEYHRLRGASRTLGPLPRTAHDVKKDCISLMPTKLDRNSLTHMLFAMHLLYENQKLDSLAHDSSIRLASLNLRLAAVLGFPTFIDHYKRDNHHVEEVQQLEFPESSSQEDVTEVPSVFDWLADCISGSCRQKYPILSTQTCSTGMFSSLCASWRSRGPAELSLQITRYYTRLYANDSPVSDILDRVESLLLEMVKDNFRRVDLDSLPFGVALPLRDALWVCRQSPSPRWPFDAFALIGREDLFNSNDLDLKSDTKARKERFLVAESRALLQIQAAATSLTQENVSWMSHQHTGNQTGENSDGKDGDTANKELDGCEIDAITCRLRFSKDRRLEEVRALLRSTDATVMTPVSVKEGDSSIDIDIVAEQKKKLSMLVQKRFAAPVGRGAFTLRTFVPSDPTKSLPVPSICTSGRIFAQRGTKVSFTPSDPTRVQWGEFHNGVAAGLRIVASDADSDGDTSQILTRSWIVNHRPSDMSGSASHAGMLFALGLGGYLPALRTTDYYEYLVPRHDLTSIGLMLGLATGNMGSMHDKITKMLCVHIRYFNGPGFAVPDFQVSVNVQTAAILGLGLLYQGSCEHPIVEGLFAELGHRPGPGDAVDDREGMALAAGLGIGLVCLGQGSSAFDAADRRLIDRLVIYAKGGSGNNGLSSPGRLGNTVFKNDAISRQESSSSGLADSETSRVKEGNFVNTNVVSPGALLALALIYLKTDDKQIAERIPMPETFYTLDRAKPSHVFLRLLARSLILWSDIQPTKKWISESLPSLIRPVRNSGDGESFDLLGRVMVGGTFHGEDTDVRGILQARAFGTAGACTSIALKYAGTNNSDAISVLIDATECFEMALLAQEKDDESMEWVYMSCLCSLAIAVAVVAAGSGDLSVLRLLRRIRKRKAVSLQHKRYGSHLAIHMAIGFLFMGGGCHTFGRSNIAIAGLLCSIYPQFPNDIGDNQYHLQALRHLYVLAVEPRCVETRDIDTGTPCCVDVEVRLKNGRLRQTRAPCIVPEASQVQEIAVVSERYWPTVVPINPPVRGKGWYSSTSAQVVFVKRRTGHLPYSLDPKGSKGLLARSLGRRFSLTNSSSASRFADVEHLFRVFSADPDILAFVKYFCNSSAASIDADNVGPKWGGQIGSYVQILYQCLSTDKPEAVRSYLDAERAGVAVIQGHACPSTVGSLIIAQAYINCHHRWYPPLLRPAYLARVIARALETVSYPRAQQALMEYVRSGGRRWPGRRSNEERDVRSDVSISIRLYRIAALNKLSTLSETMERTVCDSRRGTDAWLSFASLATETASNGAIEALLSAHEERI